MMRKEIDSRNMYIGIALAFILLIALVSVDIGPSCREAKTLNSDRIRLIADDNNTFSDLSRNMTIQTGS
jgi:hypothetical protein